MLPRGLVSFFIIMLSSLLYAGGGISWFRNTGRYPLAKQQARLRQLVSLQTKRNAKAAVHSSRAARLAHQDRTAFYNSPHTRPFQAMATLSTPVALSAAAPDPLFALRNDQMAFAWFETIEKDLAFWQDQQTALLQNLHFSYEPLDQINYARFIPSTARKIFVGEEHDHPLIYQAFEKMIFQYQQLYPQRHIIILTEFVSDRLFPWQLPGRPVHRLEMKWRRNDDDFLFFNKFLQAGIQIIGLENVAYIKEHEAPISPFENQAQSVFGLQERNAHWRQIISHVADKNPEAVLFIYTGSMHTHYRAPFSLATPSAQNFVMQWESGYLGTDMPFGFVMQQAPFTVAKPGTVTVLSWPQVSTLSTRSGFDTCFIFPKEDVAP